MNRKKLKNKFLLALVCTGLAGNILGAGVYAAENVIDTGVYTAGNVIDTGVYTAGNTMDAGVHAAGNMIGLGVHAANIIGTEVYVSGVESEESVRMQEEQDNGLSVFSEFQDNGSHTKKPETDESQISAFGPQTNTANPESTQNRTSQPTPDQEPGSAPNQAPGSMPNQEPQPAPDQTPQPAPDGPSQPTPEPTPQPTPSDDDAQPIDGSGIVISRDEMNKAIKPGEEFPVTVFVKNTYKKVQLRDIKLQFELPQGLSMNAEQKTDTFDVKDIQPGQERKLKVKLISGNLPEAVPTLTMTVRMTYRYEEEGQMIAGKLEKNILLPVSGDVPKADDILGNADGNIDGNADGGTNGGGYDGGYGGSGGSSGGESDKKNIDPMTPNIIISKYDYGKDVKAGQEFSMKLVFLNTNKQTAIENLVLTVDAGDALSIEDSSNTTYIERLRPQETFTKELRLKVLPQGQAENAKLEFNFKYEYLKKDERAQANSTEKMSIRFTQPDRFSIGDIQKEKEVTANEEATLSIPYVNKGKTTIYNMEARIVTDMSSEETYKFMGNVEAGTSGTIDFFVTPLETGKQKAKIAVTYEDAEGNEKSVEREVEINVTEGEADMYAGETMGMDGMDEYDDMQVNQAGFFTGKTIVCTGAAVVLMAFIAGVLRRRKRKRQQQEEEEIL